MLRHRSLYYLAQLYFCQFFFQMTNLMERARATPCSLTLATHRAGGGNFSETWARSNVMLLPWPRTASQGRTHLASRPTKALHGTQAQDSAPPHLLDRIRLNLSHSSNLLIGLVRIIALPIDEGLGGLEGHRLPMTAFVSDPASKAVR